ncbi:helix-turn-helix transcriptional regulator [Plantibacter sp. Mn2098]|uniref:helix-turn-helix transcriptional regulator n=1 Tax=Plantibacter sp. Mn2098 TaxID=3395266 RepID=UPI003BE50ED4
MDRHQLADFLRHRRATLRPEDVSLPAGVRRRVEGLRRVEVADLTGMSVDYYTRLEQARGPQPSTQMLAALARALRLTRDERDHLYRLSGQAAPERAGLDTHVLPALQRVLDRLDDTPALILSTLADTLVQNRLATVLFGDQTAFSGMQRSGIYRWFTDPRERQVYPAEDHARQARANVASLRVAYGIGGTNSRAARLVHELSKISREFTTLWAEHEVSSRFEDHKVLVHPEVGLIELDCQALLSEDQSQALLVLTAAPRSEAAEKLALLQVIGHQQFDTHTANR